MILAFKNIIPVSVAVMMLLKNTEKTKKTE